VAAAAAAFRVRAKPALCFINQAEKERHHNLMAGVMNPN